jgi:hypothetical protein
MPGLEVTGVVASIISAFGSGLDIFKRMRARQKAKKRNRKEPKLSAKELRLQDSLNRGPQQIRAEYNRSITKLGHRFEIGDSIAHSSLAHTLLVLNTGLINIINYALSNDTKAREMSQVSLLNLSEVAAADTLNALHQLNTRLSSSSRLALASSSQVGKPTKKTSNESSKRRIAGKAAAQVNSSRKGAKQRPGPDPRARSGWVRSTSGSSVVSAASSKAPSTKQKRNASSVSLPRDTRPQVAQVEAADPPLPQQRHVCTCRMTPPTSSLSAAHEPRPQATPHRETQNDLDLFLASQDVFDTNFAPPRPPKIPNERVASGRKPRPPSVATFMTTSTKIGEIPEHKWPGGGRQDHLRPLPYAIPPPPELEPAKRKGRGFRFWRKSHNKSVELDGPSMQPVMG